MKKKDLKVLIPLALMATGGAGALGSAIYSGAKRAKNNNIMLDELGKVDSEDGLNIGKYRLNELGGKDPSIYTDRDALIRDLYPDFDSASPLKRKIIEREIAKRMTEYSPYGLYDKDTDRGLAIINPAHYKDKRLIAKVLADIRRQKVKGIDEKGRRGGTLDDLIAREEAIYDDAGIGKMDRLRQAHIDNFKNKKRLKRNLLLSLIPFVGGTASLFALNR